MDKEILKAIESTLLGQVGNVLKKTFEKAERDEKQVENLSIQIRHLLEQNNKYAKRISEYNNLKEKEKKLEEREKRLDIILLQKDLVAEKRVVSMMEEFVKLLLRNKITRKTVLGTDVAPVDGEYPVTLQVGKDTTKTEE